MVHRSRVAPVCSLTILIILQMRFLSILFAATAAVTAQSPLTTTFASNNGQAGNMFDVRPTSAPVTIDDFDVNLAAGTWDLEIYTVIGGGSHVGNEQNPAAWQLVASIPGVVSAGPNVPTPLAQQLNIAAPCGVNTGIYVTTSNGTGINYTTGTGFVVGDVYASNADLQFLAGTGNGYPFGAVFGPPAGSRIFNGNIYYTVGAGSCGSATSYGSGCGGGDFASAYEQLGTAAMDLDGMIITGLNIGAGYLIQVAPGAGNVAQGPSAVVLPLGDDDFQDAGGTLGIWVGSNGNIARNGANSNGFTPDVATMLSNANEGLYAWTDLHSASGGGGGDIFYEENGTEATVTYLGVSGWNTGLPNTVQFKWDTATGNWSIEFDGLNTTNPEDWLVGYSPAGPNLDPGATDLSALNPGGVLLTAAADTVDLELVTNAPSIGANWDLTTNSVDAASPIAITFIGARAPAAIPLTTIGIQAPGCDLHLASADASLTGLVAGGSATATLPIPNNPALFGAMVSAQSICLTTTNAANLLSSNGVELTIQ